MTVHRGRPEVPPLGKALHCYCCSDLCAVVTVVRSGIHGNALAASQPMVIEVIRPQLRPSSSVTLVPKKKGSDGEMCV
jgi:hypothetical protein